MNAVLRFKGKMRRTRKAILELLFPSLIYHLSLVRFPTKTIQFLPEELWPGDSHRGIQIISGRFNFETGKLIVSVDPWSLSEIGSEAEASLHSFLWVRDLATVKDNELASDRLQTLVVDWISANTRWSPIAWRPDITGERIAIWLQYYNRFFAHTNKSLKKLILQSLRQQCIHLRRTWKLEESSSVKFSALKGLIFGSMYLPRERNQLDSLLKKLCSEINDQILEDGGHAERSPSQQHSVLRQLLEIRSVLNLGTVEVPRELQNAIDRMAPALRFFRHLDGGLSNFNGSREEAAFQLDLTLNKTKTTGQPPRRLPITGFERLKSGRILLLADTGNYLAERHGVVSHAGTLSIEVSIGKKRLITNCSSIISDDESWNMMQRATAAHSTLALEDKNSSELTNNGALGQRRSRVSCQRKDDDQHFSFSANHDGYLSSFKTFHLREIRLSRSTELLEGIDRLEGPAYLRFAVRFHLYPGVKVSIAQSGNSALIKLAGGEGWRLNASDYKLCLDDSIYLGTASPKRSQQIVIEGETNENITEINWNLSPVN